MKQYQYLLLDFDNTLMDFTETERRALCLTFRELFGRILTEEEVSCYNAINRGYWEMLERKEVTKEQLKEGRMRDFAKELGITEDVDTETINRVYMEYLARTVVEYPASFEVCKRLSKRYVLYIITNGTAFVQHGRMKGASFRPYIRKMFISDEIGVNKPAPEFFDAVLSETGDEDRSHYLVIGDSLTSDIRFGKNVNVDTCYVGTGDNPATYRIADISKLPDLLL